MSRPYWDERSERLNITLGMLFSKLGLPPNVWTLLSLLPAIAGFIALYSHHLLAGLGLFVLSGIIDAIDGAVARVTNSTSNLGAFLDGVIGEYVELMFYIGLFFYTKNMPKFIMPSSLWILLLVFGAIMPTFIKAYADHRKVVTDAEEQKKMGGVFGRTRRLVTVYAGMLLGHFNAVWLLYAIAIAAVLSNLTAVQRILFVIRKH
jgi:archaetidylinositol phosphate synthase